MLKKLFIALAAVVFLAMPSLALAQDYDISDYTDSLGSTYDWESSIADLSDEDLAAATAASGLALVFGGVAMVVGSVVGLAGYIYYALALQAVAKKLNMENPWYAWIPVLNMLLMAKIADMNPWLLLLMLVPGVNAFFGIYFAAITYMKIAEKRGFDKYLGLLIFVPIAQIIIPGYLAWGTPKPKAVTA